MSSADNALAGCVASLQNCSRLLDSSISILDSGVHDFPRISKVLQTTRHYELVSEPTIFKAQQALADEIGPEVERLLNRVEQYLAKLESREKTLIYKADLQDGRIVNRVLRPKPYASEVGDVEDKLKKAERLKVLQNKRERLEHTIERLALQTAHKERQLRMSTIYNIRS
ncbi:DASH complex, subunit Spc19 [Ascodesmis nigricans]|uniref:DASH complex subunit SPC19 n=1 Tax=Ascodesmis nigricans TaxID=341454 RepID=A0A4S2N2F0_9PEZI|nr:DASH complex, subunit Spc19 [Ascodesmis nigricans]